MDPMDAIKQTFFQECEEQLAELESGLMNMQGGGDAEIVNAVFRAVHSIKGGAGAFGLDDLVRFAHVFETTMDDIRNGVLEADDDVMRVMLLASDILADLVRAAQSGGVVDEERCAAVAAELASFREPGAPAGDGDDGMGDLSFAPAPIMLDLDDALGAGGPVMISLDIETMDPSAGPPSEGWRIVFTPRADLYVKANETTRLLRELSAVGACRAGVDLTQLPTFEALDPEGAYLTWTIDVVTEAGEAAVREVFDFVEWDCELSVVALTPEMSPPAPYDLGPLAGPAAPGPIPTETQARTETPASLAPVSAASLTPVSVEEYDAPRGKPTPKAKVEASAPVAANSDAPPATIRVDLDRVDRLIDLVGELVINQAMLAQSLVEIGIGRHTSLAMGLDELEQLSREIQDSVMAIRAQPVKSVFQRMPRLAREVAALTGKQVRLVTEGENTEVDKTVIERIADPLTHMIRNAIDHGLETPDVRIAAGKPAEGTVRMSALHRSGRIVIEIADDGAGINRERVRDIAVQRGLIDPDAAMSDEEIDNLIFAPGFSTADKLSDISGRGVGMDVVKRSIQALGGRISISSRPGKGSTFSMSLPLTLAVLDGMVVTVAGQTLIAPLSAIVETLKPTEAEVSYLGQNARVIRNRDVFVPLIDIGCALGFRAKAPPATEGVALLIETDGGARAALQVDSIGGQRQVVIKSLEANYQNVPGIAAATILGDGRVALILDIDTIETAARGAASMQPAQPRLALAG